MTPMVEAIKVLFGTLFDRDFVLDAARRVGAIERMRELTPWMCCCRWCVALWAMGTAASPPRKATAGPSIARLPSTVQALHEAAPAPYIKDDLYPTVGTALTEWQDKTIEIQSVIDGCVLVTDERAANSISHLAAAFS